MKVVELMQEDILTLKILLNMEIRDNKIKIDKIKNSGNEECYCLMNALKDRNKKLNNIKVKLNKAKNVSSVDEVFIGGECIKRYVNVKNSKNLKGNM